MAEFKPIETQEQLDEIIKKRVAQAERNTEQSLQEENKKLREQNEEFAKQISTLTEQAKTQTEKLEASDITIKDLAAKAQSYETASAKTRIALEAGLKYEYADRLQGNNEEEWRADAQVLAKDFAAAKKSNGAPLGSNEPVITKEHSAKSDFADWLKEN